MPIRLNGERREAIQSPPTPSNVESERRRSDGANGRCISLIRTIRIRRGDQDIDTAGTDADDQSPTKTPGPGDRSFSSREVELWQTRTQNRTARTAMWKCPATPTQPISSAAPASRCREQSHDGLEDRARARTRGERRGPGPSPDDDSAAARRRHGSRW